MSTFCAQGLSTMREFTILSGKHPETAIRSVDEWFKPARTSGRYLSSCLLLMVFMTVQGPASSSVWTARLVKDIDPSGDSHPRALTQVGDTLFFTVHARQLWKSDGTAAGTVMLKDIFPSSFPDVALQGDVTTSMNGTLFFMDFDGTSIALGKSDGTPAGTLRIKDFGANYIDMLASDGILWVCVGGNQGALWKSDGTSAGTVQVKSFNLGSSSCFCLGVYRGQVYFTVKGTADTAWRLWRSDGTLAGTTFVKDLPYAASSGQHPRDAHVVNDRLLFFTEDASGVIGLWSSDGTAAGTQLIMPTVYWIDLFYPVMMSVPVEWDQQSWSAATGNALVFGVYDATSSSVWKTDGTPAGTVKLMDVGGPPSISSEVFPIEFTDTGDGVAFFICSWNEGSHDQYELWKTDASVEHVTQVKAFAGDTAGAMLMSVANVGGSLFFGISEESTGNRIWTSDGTAAGTSVLQDVVPASGGRAPWYFTNVNGRAFCSARSTENGQELWVCTPAVPPMAAFTATPTSGAAPLTVQFTDLSSPEGLPIADWAWDFGDGHASHERSPSHVYDTNGAYTVTLTVTSDQGVDVVIHTWYIEVGEVLPVMAPAGMGLLAIALLVAGTSVLRSRHLRSPASRNGCPRTEAGK